MNNNKTNSGLIHRKDIIFDEEKKYSNSQLRVVLEILDTQFDVDAYEADIFENGLCNAPADIDYLKKQIKNALAERKRQFDAIPVVKVTGLVAKVVRAYDKSGSIKFPEHHTCDLWEIDEGYLQHDLLESEKLDYISRAKAKRCVTCLWHDGGACVNTKVSGEV